MIPISLHISGFLSYRDPVELDFTSFNLACISGPNGAGKSSLLDAFTWALFGQARKHDESLVNLQSTAADVSLVFAYEGNTYRVRRTLPRGKTSSLEFQIRQPEDGRWRALTQPTLRETQAYIQRTLRLDYETFVNASFFLQGKADQFTQQKSSDRKRILGTILGLEVWKVYQERAITRRKQVEIEINNLDGRLAEIHSELDEEQARTERLAALQVDLKHLAKARKAEEQLLEHARKVDATLAEQRKLVDMLGRQFSSAQLRQTELESRLEARVKEGQSYAQKVERAAEIEAAYASWQAQRQELERWEEVAARFREHEARRQAPRLEIESERARLSQELESLRAEERNVRIQDSARLEYEVQVITARKDLEQAESLLQKRAELDDQLQGARMRQAEARAENPRLKTEMDDLKARMNTLAGTEEAACPLCGRPLDVYERANLLEEINVHGTELGDRFRANQAYLKDAEQNVRQLETEIASLSRVEQQRLALAQTISRLSSQVESVQNRLDEWHKNGAVRMAEVEKILDSESFSTEARQVLGQIDEELKAIGYDAAGHEACRRQEALSRNAEAEFHSLETARAALQPLEREIAGLQEQTAASHTELSRSQQDYDESIARLAAAEAEAPDLEAAERSLHDLLEQENSLRMEVGAAQQKVLVLKDLKVRLKELNAQREEHARLVGQYKQLERAFGKDGVPALLIEQALPEIETRANILLDRLSAGNMSIRFATQAAFKDKKREDMKETLDILISDGAGTRDYELYSGGEAFRVNFALRLALSEVLAKRAGARLQTLVVDEGFGSQDAMGRQHLLEAINLVRDDFAKILVITHIEELKEAFPNRIEVEKTEHGSVVTVV